MAIKRTYVVGFIAIFFTYGTHIHLVSGHSPIHDLFVMNGGWVIFCLSFIGLAKRNMKIAGYAAEQFKRSGANL